MKVELVEQSRQPDWRPASVRFSCMTPFAVTAALHCSDHAIGGTRLWLDLPEPRKTAAQFRRQRRVCGRMLLASRLALSNATPHQNNVGE